MSEEILINITPQETRVAVVENGVLFEVYIERSTLRGIVGNIYSGVVSRVLPGMQAAFVDIGLERAAFLHQSDITSRNGNGKNKEDKTSEPIAAMIHEGQRRTVQVVKDPLGTKGARITTHVSIPSRYLVFMPELEAPGISQRIESSEERKRLRDIIGGFSENIEKGSFIARTAAEGVSGEALNSDMDFLYRAWNSTQEALEASKGGQVVYEDLPLALRALRDFISPTIEKIRIDSRETYERAIEFSNTYIPDITERIEYYPGERPVFDLYGVEDEIQKALNRHVQLKSGGHLVFDQTEAMTTIDVNTGAFVGSRNLEETIYKTNLEAAQSISRQLRLRNLGGIIIIDFIDMVDENHKRTVLRALEKSLEQDSTRTFISEVSSLGLVQMTRKRVRESLGHVMCEPCSVCQGRGVLKTATTVCYEIFRELLRESRQFDASQWLVLASQEVVDMMLDEESTSLADLGEFIGKPIRLQVEALYIQEQFDVVPT